jgi:hypothetical protein
LVTKLKVFISFYFYIINKQNINFNAGYERKVTSYNIENEELVNIFYALKTRNIPGAEISKRVLGAAVYDFPFFIDSRDYA